MADYRKYAENLIGNWNTDQYEPQRSIVRDINQTNWDRIQMDYDNYIDSVQRNLDRARTNYYNNLASADRNSFLRVNSAVENLAKRGMLNSGVANRYIQADTTARGNEVNNALYDIINTNTGLAGKLGDLTNTMASKENALVADLGGKLAGLTAKEQANDRGYANLAAGLAASAEARDLANGKSAKKKQEELDELNRRLLIAKTITNTEMSDNQKERYLSIYLDVPGDVARSAIKGYNDNNTIKEALNSLSDYNIKIKEYDNDKERKNEQGRWDEASYGSIFKEIKDSENRRNADLLRKQLSDMSYTDLYELLFGDGTNPVTYGTGYHPNLPFIYGDFVPTSNINDNDVIGDYYRSTSLGDFVKGSDKNPTNIDLLKYNPDDIANFLIERAPKSDIETSNSRSLFDDPDIRLLLERSQRSRNILSDPGQAYFGAGTKQNEENEESMREFLRRLAELYQ